MNADAQHGIIFLPFLRIRKSLTVAGVEFLRLRDAEDKTPPSLESAAAPLTTS